MRSFVSMQQKENICAQEEKNAREPVLKLRPAATVPDWEPKNQSIPEMKICRFIAHELNENIHLQLKKTP